MLFTDGIILCPEKLREHDNHILEVASTESIELSSKLAIAQRQIGYELTSFLLHREVRTGLSHVFVDDELRDLLAVKTLAAVYRDAYYRHLNDRYEGRAKEFQALADHSLRRLLENGVGLVNFAVQRAEQPLVEAIGISSGLEPGIYTIQVAWQHAFGSVGEWSEAVSLDCSDSAIRVVPPVAPMDVAGWHLSIGLDTNLPTRQNDAPIAPGTDWTQAAYLRTDLAAPKPSGADYHARSTAQQVRR